MSKQSPLTSSTCAKINGFSECKGKLLSITPANQRIKSTPGRIEHRQRILREHYYYFEQGFYWSENGRDKSTQAAQQYPGRKQDPENRCPTKHTWACLSVKHLESSQ